MKGSLFYLMVGWSTVVAQTTILRLPVFGGIVPDLLIPFIVFLSLHRPDRQGISVTLLLGLIMDLISGGIFGVYLSIYFWIFLSARGLSRTFDVGKTFFQAPLIGLYVLGENAVLFVSLPSAWQEAELLASRAVPVMLQTVVGVVTGPGILRFLKRLQTRFELRSSTARKESEDLRTCS